uniref:CIDE-N domain-containing protein n=1 Tax=Trichogramma kaykai TaxID=54128 RepID=A0ABD2W5C4_9HYME
MKEDEHIFMYNIVILARIKIVSQQGTKYKKTQASLSVQNGDQVFTLTSAFEIKRLKGYTCVCRRTSTGITDQFTLGHFKRAGNTFGLDTVSFIDLESHWCRRLAQSVHINDDAKFNLRIVRSMRTGKRHLQSQPSCLRRNKSSTTMNGLSNTNFCLCGYASAMPLYTIEHPGKKKLMIKAENIAQIIDTATEKFNLDKEKSYKILLMPEDIEIDDDEILAEFSKEHRQTPITFKVIDVNNNSDPPENLDSASPVIPPVCKDNGKISQIISVEDGLFAKLPVDILEMMIKKEKIVNQDLTTVCTKVKEYMAAINNKTRSKAEEIAKLLCHKYPDSFRDTHTKKNSTQTFGQGHEKLFIKIYNAVNYKKRQDEKKKLSDNNRKENDPPSTKTKTKMPTDEYGCVEYAPSLPEGEDFESQEEKKKSLLEVFPDNQENLNISRLMLLCYPTVRLNINNRESMNDLEKAWPFLQRCDIFIAHASRLLGKDIMKEWELSVEHLADTAVDKLKSNVHVIKNDQFTNVLTEYKNAVTSRRDVKPHIIASIILVIMYFQEDQDLFFTITKDDDFDFSSISTPYPIMLIKGYSIYDELASVQVIIERDYMIEVSDPVEGILVTFLSYYVFGFAYPEKLAKSLEFIQRWYFGITPAEGSKAKSKRKKNYDAAVRKLITSF